MLDRLISLNALRKEVERNFDMQNLYLPVHILDFAEDVEEGIVRCKDCEDACICSDDWVICTHIDSNGNDKHPTDWFCADGRRRDE